MIVDQELKPLHHTKMEVLPLFKSQYSVGRSILTLAAPEDKIDENYPVSIFDIAKHNGLDTVTVIDDSISGFLEAHQNAKKAKIKLVYGVLLRCMENIENKCDASLKTISKVAVIIKNSDGYADLIKITSCASKKGFYYKPNIDFRHLKELWTKNLLLAIPFYDSFLFRNSVQGYLCVPNISFTEPIFFVENSGLPFDKLVQDKVHAFTKTTNAQTLQTRSIYYYKKSDFLSYLTFRCLHERTNLSKPQLDHMSSDKFNFEEWERQNAGREPITLR